MKMNSIIIDYINSLEVYRVIIKKEDVLFWLGIMRDHAAFQISSLSYKEQVYVQKALGFMQSFENIAQRISSDENLEVMIPNITNVLKEFLTFKRKILKELVSCRLEMGLPPSLINHQINEGMEFQYALLAPDTYYKNFEKPMTFIYFLKSWITDSSGHAATYGSFLDPSEGLLRNEAISFKNSFDLLAVKVGELEITVMQSGDGEGAVDLLVMEAAELMKNFILYLQKIFKLRSECKVMGIGTLTPLLPNHMIREHEYFLKKVGNM